MLSYFFRLSLYLTVDTVSVTDTVSSLTVCTSERIYNPGTGVMRSLIHIKGVITDK
jgi:hypothetical protein